MKPFWDPDHPVLTMLRNRRKQGSTIDSREDAAKVGLAVEGGGMRGIISCAMLNALEDDGFGDAFDAVYGGSSGSVNAAYFIAGDMWHALSIYYDDLASQRFIDFRRLLRNRSMFDVDFAFDVVFDLIKPLDYPAVLASAVPLHVSITLVDELRTITPTVFEDRQDLKDALRAGAWLPLATKGSATFRGQRAIDGGALTSHPSRLALADGCTHVLSLSTRPTTYERDRPDAMQRYAGWRLNRMRAGLGTRFLDADRVGAQDRRALARWRIQPDDSPAVLDLCPERDSGLARHDIDSGRLQANARSAYETMAWALSGVYERAFPRLTTLSRQRRGHDTRQ